MTTTRAPVEVLLGEAAGAVRGIEGDFAMLEARAPSARVWECTETAVVLGVSRDFASEIDEAECTKQRVAVLRRASGGGTVVIGSGTLQYALAFPHAAGAEPPSIEAVKRLCSRLVADALADSGVEADVDSDASGDLHVAARKVAGVSLRRRRDATLLHGTLLVDADLARIAALLRHPAREPAWRQGRPHLAFLANLGHFDRDAFLRSLQRQVTASR